MNLNKWFGQIAETVSHAAGHAVAFIICCIVVIVWAASGQCLDSRTRGNS